MPAASGAGRSLSKSGLVPISQLCFDLVHAHNPETSGGAKEMKRNTATMIETFIGQISRVYIQHSESELLSASVEEKEYLLLSLSMLFERPAVFLVFLPRSLLVVNRVLGKSAGYAYTVRVTRCHAYILAREESFSAASN